MNQHEPDGPDNPPEKRIVFGDSEKQVPLSDKERFEKYQKTASLAVVDGVKVTERMTPEEISDFSNLMPKFHKK